MFAKQMCETHDLKPLARTSLGNAESLLPSPGRARALLCAGDRGYSLVEVLVVVVVIALLIGITLPALAAVRSRAGYGKSLANLYGLGVTMQVYHERYGAYPFFDAGQELVFTPEGHTPALRVGIAPEWDIERYWPCVMHGVAPWREHFGTWVSPGLDREPGRAWLKAGSPSDGSTTAIDPSYRYSNSFVATAETWMATGDARFAAQRADGVAHPSGKTLMLDHDAAYLRREVKASDPRPVLFADGSAAGIADKDVREGATNRLRPGAVKKHHDTGEGVRGRDR